MLIEEKEQRAILSLRQENMENISDIIFGKGQRACEKCGWIYNPCVYIGCPKCNKWIFDFSKLGKQIGKDNEMDYVLDDVTTNEDFQNIPHEEVSISSLQNEPIAAFDKIDKLLKPFGLEIELTENSNEEVFYIRVKPRQ